MTRGRVCGMLVIALLGVAQLGAVQQDTMSATEGVALVRQVNTIMGQLMLRNNAYMTLEDVVMHPTFTRAEGVELTNADSGTYKRYRLTVVGVVGLQSYQLSLVPANGCGPSWFSNETHLIFTGTCVP